MRFALIPASITATAFALHWVAPWYYLESGWYMQEPTASGFDLFEEGLGAALLYIFFAFGLLLFLKYLMYEVFMHTAIVSLKNKTVARIWFYAVYALTIIIDFYFVFASVAPQKMAGLAILGLVFSSVILFAGWLMLIISKRIRLVR